MWKEGRSLNEHIGKMFVRGKRTEGEEILELGQSLDFHSNPLEFAKSPMLLLGL